MIELKFPCGEPGAESTPWASPKSWRRPGMREPDTVKALRLYRSQGVNALPLCPAKGHEGLPAWHRCGTPGKVPLGAWLHCKGDMLEDWRFESWLRALASLGLEPNVGVVMGPVSKVTSLDADGPEAVEWCESTFGGSLDTARFETGRGMRWVYSLSSLSPPRSKTLRPGVEVLSWGRQSVFPPSLHANGKRYRWVGCNRLTWMKKLRHWPFGHGEADSGLGPGPRPEYAERALSLGERNSSLFKMACALRRHGAPYEAILGSLGHLNMMCLVPLDGEELEAIARSAARYAPHGERRAA